MKLDFSDFPFSSAAYSARPMTFCEPGVGRCLSALADLAAIETGPRRAREAWRQAQLRNVFAHAARRSPFWRARLGALGEARLEDAPILTRADLREQVAREGALLGPADRIGVTERATSGSTGEPVRFFVSEMNANYNVMRSIAQYFLEGRDLTLNRALVDYASAAQKADVTVERSGSWLGALAAFVAGGSARTIAARPGATAALWRELKREPIGYLVAAPGHMAALIAEVGAAALREAGAAMWLAYGERVDAALREELAAAGIATRANYSCEEVGPIGAECERHPGRYHVATSNVIVEVEAEDEIRLGEARVGRALLTALHSYATPIIRYDVGDLAALEDRCPCGHDGPTLSNVVGRSKGLLKHPDGRLSPFFVWAHEMTAIAPFDEFRIRQTAPGKLVVEIGGRESLSGAETASFMGLIASRASGGFDIEVRAVAAIDWGESVKRLGFHNELL